MPHNPSGGMIYDHCLKWLRTRWLAFGTKIFMLQMNVGNLHEGNAKKDWGQWMRYKMK